MITVVYDADCGVCQASAAFIRRRDPGGRFELIANDVPELPAGVDRAETEQTMVVLDGGRKLTRADGVARILRELPRWRVPAALLRVPGLRQAANAGYSLFARHRHRVSAALGMDACAVPPRERR